MKLTITRLLFLVWPLTACGSLVEEQLLKLEMFGVSDRASDSEGNETPDFQTYVLTGVALLHSDGSTRTQLFDPETTTVTSSFRIIDRAQLIYSKAIKDLVGTQYNGIEVSFAESIVGGNEERSDLSLTLSSPILTLSRAFEVEKAQSLLLEIKVKWGDTILDAAMSEPDYELLLNGK